MDSPHTVINTSFDIFLAVWNSLTNSQVVDGLIWCDIAWGKHNFQSWASLSVTSKLPNLLKFPHVFSCDQAVLWMVFSVRLSVCHTFLYARLKNGTYYAVAMSVRLSVRPSVRPSVRVFRTFLQHVLRYQFETWYIHSVGGTTCWVWVASQLG